METPIDGRREPVSSAVFGEDSTPDYEEY